MGLFGAPTLETANSGVNIYDDAYLVSTNSSSVVFRVEDGGSAALTTTLWTSSGPRCVSLTGLSSASLAAVSEGGVIVAVQNLPSDSRFYVQVC